MSSVLVKGMKMPENCIKCPLQFGGWCYASPPEIDERVAPTVDEAWEQGKPDWCPLVALPDKHGRLVDADALEKILEKIPAADIKNMGGQAYVLVKLSQVFNVIDNQPTIEPRKKGKWIMALTKDLIGFNTVCFRCSECNGMEYSTSPFCRVCGAKMEDGRR